MEKQHHQNTEIIKTLDLGINTSTLHPYRVMIVEDSASARLALKRVLERYRFKIAGEAQNGKEMLEVLPKMSYLPDIICIDQNMPVLDGISTIKILRKIEAYKDIKVIMITGYSQKELVQDALKYRVNGFILKPIDPKAIMEKLATLLNRKELLEEDKAYKSTSIDLNQISIPSLPEVIFKVSSFDIHDTDKGIVEFEEIIAPDSGASSIILKLANSSYYGRPKKITNTKEAITLLGVRTSRDVILVDYNKKLNKHLTNPLFKKYLRAIPILSSLIAIDLAKYLFLNSLEKNIFLIVLLRTIGMNVLAQNFTEKYLKILKLFEFSLKPIFFLEKEEFNITSIDLGKKIFKVWKMPDFFIDSVSNQNFTKEQIKDVADYDRIARLSDILAKKMLQVQILTEEELEGLIFEYYKTAPGTIKIFGEEYFEKIKTHPFLSVLSQ